MEDNIKYDVWVDRNMNPLEGTMIIEEPDIDTVNERLWELYLVDCDNKKLRPTVSDYLIWVDEKYL